MRQIVYIIFSCALLCSCVRRELTYSYNPTVEIVINADWSDMSEEPSGMSVYCYPDDGGSPVIKQTNSVNSTTVSLGVGEYKILVFNQIPSDFGTINFNYMDDYEQAEVTAASTTSKWYASKSDDEELVRDPEELAIATYHTVDVTQAAVDEVLGLTEKYEGTDMEIEPYIIIYVEPKVVIKTTRVTVAIDGIDNLASVRSTLTGMASGYDISEQTTHASYATHLLESWSIINIEEFDVTQGDIVAYFTCFGLPEITVQTRDVDSSWGGTIYLDYLLVDLATIVSSEHLLYDKTTLITNDEDATNRSDSEESEIDDADVDISIDIDDGVSLPDVEPVGGSSGGFDAQVDEWTGEEKVELPT